MIIYLSPSFRINIWPHTFGIGFMLSLRPFLLQFNLSWFGIAFEGLTDPCSCSTCMMEREIERRMAIERGDICPVCDSGHPENCPDVGAENRDKS